MDRYCQGRFANPPSLRIRKRPIAAAIHDTQIKQLINQLTSGDEQTAESAANQIAGYGTAAVPLLQELASSSSPDTRWWALRTLAEIPTAEASAVILGALDDPEPTVRQCAALGLRINPHPDAVPHLIEALDSTDPLYTSLATDALIAVGSPAVADLITAAQSGASRVRIEAVRALALIGDKRAIPVLFSLLEESSAVLTYWAEEGLERMGVGMTFFSSQ